MSWYLNPSQVKGFVLKATRQPIYAANAERVLQEMVTASDKHPTDSVTFNIFLSYRTVDSEYAAGVYVFLIGLRYNPRSVIGVGCCFVEETAVVRDASAA